MRWRNLHLIRQPLSDYLRYAFEWVYTYSSEVGQDSDARQILTLDQLGEFVDRHHAMDLFRLEIRRAIAVIPLHAPRSFLMTTGRRSVPPGCARRGRSCADPRAARAHTPSGPPGDPAARPDAAVGAADRGRGFDLDADSAPARQLETMSTSWRPSRSRRWNMRGAVSATASSGRSWASRSSRRPAARECLRPRANPTPSEAVTGG